jgi:hypothetical protein
MLPEIGLIVAIYTVVRFIQFISDRAGHPIVKVVSGLGLIATLFLAYALVSSGSHMPNPAP